MNPEGGRAPGSAGAGRAVAAGIGSALLGLHFTAGAAAAAVARRSPAGGITLMILAGAVTYVAGGLEGVLLTSVVTACLFRCSAARSTPAACAAVTASASVLASAASLLVEPGIMGITRDALEALTPIYAAAGIPQGQMGAVLDTIVYLSPGIGALQLSLGAIMAVVFFGTVSRGALDARRVDVRLGLAPAWMVIVCMGACLLGRRAGLPPDLVRAACSILVFMTAPYGAVGIAVTAEMLRGRPYLVFFALMAVVLATPAAVATLVAAGLFDTWFDFRSRMRAARQGPESGGPPGNNDTRPPGGRKGE